MANQLLLIADLACEVSLTEAKLDTFQSTIGNQRLDHLYDGLVTDQNLREDLKYVGGSRL
jgi:hypothetical protein